MDEVAVPGLNRALEAVAELFRRGGPALPAGPQPDLTAQQLTDIIGEMAPIAGLGAAIAAGVSAAAQRTWLAAGSLSDLARDMFVLMPYAPGLAGSFKLAVDAVRALPEMPDESLSIHKRIDATRPAVDQTLRLSSAMAMVMDQVVVGLSARVLAADRLAAAANTLLKNAGELLPGSEELEKALTRAQAQVRQDLAQAERPARPDPPDRVRAASEAHSAVTALEEVTERVLTVATLGLAERVESARSLQAVLTGSPMELTAELASASEAVRQIRDRQPRSSTADQDVNLAVQWATDAGAAYAAVTRLLAAARAAAVDAAGPLDEFQPDVMAVAELLPAAQRLLPAADPATGALTQRLAAAARRLAAAQPPWWPARAANLTTAEQARMIIGAKASQAVTRQSLLAGITGVVTDVHKAVADRAGLVAGRATAAQGLLTASDQRALGDTLDDIVRRARAMERSQPPPATLAGVEAAVRDLERLNDLQAVADRVIAEATAGLPQRLADAPDLTAAALALLPHSGTQRGDLERRVAAAQAGVSALPAWPGSLAAAANVEAAASALTRLTDLENAARDVLVAATGPTDLLLRLVADERRLALMVRPLGPHIGEPQRRDELMAAGNAAVGRLHGLVPQWWPQRATAVPSADLLREAGHLLDAGLEVRVRRTADELRRTADAMLRAAAGSRQEQLNRAAELTADVRAELRHTGAAQAALTAAAGRVERAADAVPLVPGILKTVLPRQFTALDGHVTRAAGGMAELTEAITELREAFQGTPWIRARALLGAGQHGFSPAQVTAVITLADQLRPGRPPVRLVNGPVDRLRRAVTGERDNVPEPDAELFAWLAEQVGLHHQRDLHRRVQVPDLLLLFRLLDLAAEVFGEGQATLADVRNLRRLADLRKARAGLENGLATQRITANLAVSLTNLLPDELTAPRLALQEQVRALARMVGQAKEATGRRAVTRQDLRALRDGAESVERAHQHLDARLDLTAADVDLLLRRLLDGPATDDALRAVVGLLRVIEPDELTRLLRGSQLAERLIRLIPPNHRVRGELERFVVDRFGSSVRPEDLSGGQAPPKCATGIHTAP